MKLKITLLSFIIIFLMGSITNYCKENSLKEKLQKPNSTLTDFFRDQIIEDWIDGEWVISSKTIVTETSGKVNRVVTEAWEDGAVIYATRWTFNYNGDSEISEWISEVDEDGTGNFVYTSKEIMTYTGGKNTGALSQTWEDGEWFDNSRDTYTYSGDKLTQMLTEENMIVSWENEYLVTYNYSGDNLAEQLWQDWDGSGWINATRYMYTYDNQNRETSSAMENWDGAAWTAFSTTTKAYDVNGDMVEEEYGGEIMPGFVIKDKTVYTYENHKVVLEENYDWDFITNDYYTFKTSQISHTYNDDLLYQSIEQLWDPLNNISVNSSRTTYGKVTDVDEQPVIPEYFELANYPNPFNPNTNIQFLLPEQHVLSINIYNIKGELINRIVNKQFYNAGTHKVSWNGDNLTGEKVSSGVYLISVSSEKFNKIRKCVLMK
ncbi:MAG: T9SS type A sorting domain-containing protein [Melioribacteraceae bacterium]|nr:T9SS type A sorting domain-containing protein [Melioribacteraceae bacterium]